jgi:predicted DNA-binding antitoxin AbrB/MazE fold protein
METIHAIFEGGVLRPMVPVTLQEHMEYAFEPRPVAAPSKGNDATPQELVYSEDGLSKVYEILSERYASGHTDTAARHNEHQP